MNQYRENSTPYIPVQKPISPKDDPTLPIQFQHGGLVRINMQHLNSLDISPPLPKKQLTDDKDVSAWLQYWKKVSYDKYIVLRKW